MKRALFSFALGSLLLLGVISPAHTQTRGHSAVRVGDVTGLELGLEGAQHAYRGGSVRWLLVAHEVVGLSDLRPAEGTRVRVLTSLNPTAPAMEVTTDAYGRATVELAIPEDAPEYIGVVLEAVGRSGVQRRFELGFTTKERRSVDVRIVEQTIAPGARAHAVVRLYRADTREAIPSQVIEIVSRDNQGRPIETPTRCTTDGAGLCAYEIDTPVSLAEGGVLTIGAATTPDSEGRRAEDHVGIPVAAPGASALVVGVRPGVRVAEPGDTVSIDVVVRTDRGHPVEGAILRGSWFPERPRIRTDARGRARLSWRAPQISEVLQDVGLSVSASRAGVGGGSGHASVRVTSLTYFSELTIAGGRLPANLGGTAYVRVLRADGSPAPAGVAVGISGPRIANQLEAQTDASGVATFDNVTLRSPDPDAPDTCGGEAATGLAITIAGSNANETCASIDVDAAVALRLDAHVKTRGGHVRATVIRSADASGLPVVLTLMGRLEGGRHGQGGELLPLASHVLAGTDSTFEVPLPAELVGVAIVRARVLVGRERQEARGSIAALYVLPGAAFSITPRFVGASRAVEIAFEGEARADRSTIAVAVPLASPQPSASPREALLGDALADLRLPFASASDALIAAALAKLNVRDDAAPTVLRGRDLVTVPAPVSPVAHGLLRDPWRARARFVGGRLATILLALEEHVASSLPSNIDDVAVRTARGWDFNSQVFDAMQDGGAEGGVRGLGGEPIGIDVLRRLDPSFNYDNVARRITRKRLFHLLFALRELTRSNGLDMRWSWRGDPTQWLRHLDELETEHNIQDNELVDGWGRPFQIRPAAGGRVRFTMIAPVAGYEIVSAGPDGRFGNGDDLWDPTARILPSTSLYGRAVGEDVLVARLRGVELGRATITLAEELFSTQAPELSEEAVENAGASTTAIPLPSMLPSIDDALRLRRPQNPGSAVMAPLTTMDARGGSLSLPIDDEPRVWEARVFACSPEGFCDVGRSSDLAGSNVIVDAPELRRLRRGERVSMDVQITNVTEAVLEIFAETPPAPSLEVGAFEGFRLEPEETRSVTYTLLGTTSGPTELALGVRTRRTDGQESRGTTGRTLRHALVIDEGAHPIRRRGATLIDESAREITLEVPEDATSPRGRVVLLAPYALADDPDLRELRRRDPALIAWAHTLAGRALDAELRASLLRAELNSSGVFSGDAPSLSTAAAVVALSAGDEHDRELSSARARAISVLGAGGVGNDGVYAVERTTSAILAALATGGVPEGISPSEGALDPVALYVATTRTALRRVLRDAPGEPTLLARAAAGLLISDPRDGIGRAMFERVLTSLIETDVGPRVRPSEALDDGTEAVVATLALAIAARQLDRATLADALLASALADDNLLTRRGGEASFWLLAAGAYGAFGVGEVQDATVEIDGRSHAVRLEGGRAILPIEGMRAGSEHEVSMRAGGSAVRLLGRVETVYGVPFEDRGGPFELTLQGDVGASNVMAALELTVRAISNVTSDSFIEIRLPAGVLPDDALLQVLRGAPGVVGAEAREPGLLRIRLRPMTRDQKIAIPLPLRWGLRGTLRGLGMVAYPVTRPASMSVLEERTLNIQRERVED